MTQLQRSSLAVVLFLAACSGPADPPDAAEVPDAGTDTGTVEMVDAAMEEDAAIADAFVPPDVVDYDGGPPATWDEVYAIFTPARCGGGTTGCHIEGTAGTLSLATSATACSQLHRAGRSPSCSIRERVVAGDLNASLLYRKLVGPPAGCGDIMPDRGDPLTPEEISVVGRWILAGAICP
jgi:hypothetical protein